QDLGAAGCRDDLISISQRRDFAALVDDDEHSIRDGLFRDAVREQTEIEIYVPLRSAISKYLVYAHFNEDVEIKYKVHAGTRGQAPELLQDTQGAQVQVGLAVRVEHPQGGRGAEHPPLRQAPRRRRRRQGDILARLGGAHGLPRVDVLRRRAGPTRREEGARGRRLPPDIHILLRPGRDREAVGPVRAARDDVRPGQDERGDGVLPRELQLGLHVRARARSDPGGQRPERHIRRLKEKDS
ncbi:hypothetical protein THAOC_15062, partial [Thalassiosira oceanica]